jgi:hypothetical protein
MADYKERVSEMLLELLDAAPGRAEDPLYNSLSDTVRKWGDQRQRALDRLMTLVVKAQTEPADQLAQEWKVEIERTRSLLKLIFRLDTGGQKLPMWAQTWMMVTLIAEDDFFNGLQMVQTIELIGKIKHEKVLLEIMQDHLSKKWTLLNDLTAPFRTQQMVAIDEIDKIANAFLQEFESEWKKFIEKASQAYNKTTDYIDELKEKVKYLPSKEAIIIAIDQVLGKVGLNTEGLKDAMDQLSTMINAMFILSGAKNGLVLERVRYYKDNLRSQGFILRLFAEERRLVREYERTNGVDAATLYHELAHDSVGRWAAERVTAGQKDDAEPIEALLVAQLDIALAGVTQADALFRKEYTGLFVEKPSDETEEALTHEAAFDQRRTNFAALDIDDKINRLNESSNKYFEDAVDRAFDQLENSISDLPDDATETLLVKSREMHAAVKDLLEEQLMTMIDASTKLGKEFDRDTLEEAFSRRELVEAVDR